MATLRLAVLAAVLAVLALALPGAAPAQTACPGADDVPTADNLPAVRAATRCLVNRERTQRGLRALKSNRRLCFSAILHSQDMVDHRYFAHDSQDGSSFGERIRRTGYLSRARGYQLGENIAWGTGDLATPAQIVDAWMHSPGHRRNILNRRFRQIGVGIVPGAPDPIADGLPAATYTTDFGARK